VRIERIDWSGEDPVALAVRLRAAVPALEDARAAVTEVLERVRREGDAALRELGAAFGEPEADALRVDGDLIARAPERIGTELRDALEAAAANVRTVAEAQLEACPLAVEAALDAGQRVEVRRSAVAAAGVYAPGGRGAYPSSVLMCAIPARVAEVGRVAVASPPAHAGRPGDAVLAACAIAGVDELYAVGGAQAIAALAYGTESIAPVDVIAGPGNRYVTEAKRQLAGHVGIDGLAGPSELVVLADATADPWLLALDLCAQAEHGEDTPLVCVCADQELLARVADLVAQLAADRPSVSSAPLALVTAPDLDAALALADAVAPEHLELAFAGAAEAASERVAGCVFVGAAGATAFGDYVAGSNHVLPTGGAARFGGPLGPEAYLRRTSVVSIPARAAEALAPHVAALSAAEGFPVHGESAAARLER